MFFFFSVGGTYRLAGALGLKTVADPTSAGTQGGGDVYLAGVIVDLVLSFWYICALASLAHRIASGEISQ
jgi:hypothetical protein